MVVPGGIHGSVGNCGRMREGERFGILRQLLILPQWLSLPPGSTWRPWGMGTAGRLEGRHRSQGQHSDLRGKQQKSHPAEWLRPLSLSLIEAQPFCSCLHLHSLEVSLRGTIISHCPNSFIRRKEKALKSSLMKQGLRRQQAAHLSSHFLWPLGSPSENASVLKIEAINLRQK